MADENCSEMVVLYGNHGHASPCCGATCNYGRPYFISCNAYPMGGCYCQHSVSAPQGDPGLLLSRVREVVIPLIEAGGTGIQVAHIHAGPACSGMPACDSGSRIACYPAPGTQGAFLCVHQFTQRAGADAILENLVQCAMASG